MNHLQVATTVCVCAVFHHAISDKYIFLALLFLDKKNNESFRTVFIRLRYENTCHSLLALIKHFPGGVNMSMNTIAFNNMKHNIKST